MLALDKNCKAPFSPELPALHALTLDLACSTAPAWDPSLYLLLSPRRFPPEPARCLGRVVRIRATGGGSPGRGLRLVIVVSMTPGIFAPIVGHPGQPPCGLSIPNVASQELKGSFLYLICPFLANQSPTRAGRLPEPHKGIWGESFPPWAGPGEVGPQPRSVCPRRLYTILILGTATAKKAGCSPCSFLLFQVLEKLSKY